MTQTRILTVLGDQLSPNLAALRDGDPDRDRVLMAEVVEEATYVPHHKKKIAFVFAAMRAFAEELRDAGWQVDYICLDDPGNTGAIRSEVARAVKRHEACGVVITRPNEWRLAEDVAGWEADLDVPVAVPEDDRFLCSRAAFADWAEGRKQLRMEYFYREMRRKTGLLMDGDDPEGGNWNYDSENRKPPGDDLDLPQPMRFDPDGQTGAVLDLVESRFDDHFGTLRPFWFPVTRSDAEAAFDHFVEHALPRFGDYQDAMLTDAPFLFHSVISPCLNVGLLDPLAVCKRVEKAYRDGHAPLNAAEGFIRQIIGWREFIRGVYWHKMPAYLDSNFLNAKRDLPDFYWTGDTDMACMKAAIGQTRDEAYAHHIQRLMVTGNFALLAGIDPAQVHEWYLAVYADAYEWVELPNVMGMALFADGGVLASKPYAASGNYINKMSDYCGSCRYKVTQKTGEGACPFNPLYWDFLLRNRDTLKGNPRLGAVYRTWGRMKSDKQDAYRESAAAVLEALDQL